MEPPSTPRKPRRPKATPENSQESTPDAASSTPKRRRTTKTEDSSTATPKTTRASSSRSKAPVEPTPPAPEPVASLDPPEIPPVVAESPSVVPGSVVSAPPPSAIGDDEPDIFKPLPPESAPVAVVVTSTQAVAAQEGADRYMKLLRTWTVRNVEIVRKSFASTNAASDSSTATPVDNLAERSTSSLDNSLDRLQKRLETSDAAVLVATLVFIIVCMVATLAISAAFR